MNFYACISKTKIPLGYVKADNIKEAQTKALAKYGFLFGYCYKYEGVL